MTKTKYDYLVVGAGLFGATFAQQAAQRGKTSLVVDQRDHVAGNCFTKDQNGIDVHKFGPHQFHTRSKKVWDYLQTFTTFNHYRAHVVARCRGRLYPMPPGLRLFSHLWGVTDPKEARDLVNAKRTPHPNPTNLEDWVLDQVGTEIYEMFYKGYSTKQWGRDPKTIPASTARRLPVRFTWDDCWFDDPYQGIPDRGYTRMVENMLNHREGVETLLNTDYFEHRADLDRAAGKTVYSGKLDQLLGYKFGELHYRSLRFEEVTLNTPDFQGNAIVNHTDLETPYTRSVEHKHFQPGNKSPNTVVTREFPEPCDHPSKTPYYPVEDPHNTKTRTLYEKELRDHHPNIVVGGRLGKHRYFDMDQTVANALAAAARELEGENPTL